MRTTTGDRVEILRKRREAIDKQLGRLEATQRSEHRKEDTRRKILLGALVLREIEAHPDQVGAWARKLLSEGLIRPRDRALFDLPVLDAPVTTVGIGTLASGEDGVARVSVELQMPKPDPGPPERPTEAPRRPGEKETPGAG